MTSSPPADRRKLMSVWRVPLRSRAAPTAAPASSSQVFTPNGDPGEEEEHIPRPSNAFMIFRRWYAKKHAGEAGGALSRRAGDAWRALSIPDRAEWEEQAESEKQEHARRYPNWRYRPRRRAQVQGPPHLKPTELPPHGLGKRALSMPVPPDRPPRAARTRRALSDAAASTAYVQTYPARSATYYVPEEAEEPQDAQVRSTLCLPRTFRTASTSSAPAASLVSPLAAVQHSWESFNQWRPLPQASARSPWNTSADAMGQATWQSTSADPSRPDTSCPAAAPDAYSNSIPAATSWLPGTNTSVFNAYGCTDTTVSEHMPSYLTTTATSTLYPSPPMPRTPYAEHPPAAAYHDQNIAPQASNHVFQYAQEQQIAAYDEYYHAQRASSYEQQYGHEEQIRVPSYDEQMLALAEYEEGLRRHSLVSPGEQQEYFNLYGD
ncbi:hypothetical protein BD626DRAFT_506473, partial [Schizophyllum amplum]